MIFLLTLGKNGKKRIMQQRFILIICRMIERGDSAGVGNVYGIIDVTNGKSWI